MTRTPAAREDGTTCPGPVVVVALDKFKGSLSAAETCAALAEGLRAGAPGLLVREVPVADGGEGTCDMAVRAGFGSLDVPVRGPLGEPATARLALRGDVAVLESAQACGLGLVPLARRDALLASSYGVGQMIGAALDAGARRIVLGLGGSACTDGGAGMLQALGVRLSRADGTDLPPGGGALVDLARVDPTGLDPRLGPRSRVHITLASDVDNPLVGPRGAAAVFAPQKGAELRDVARLEAGLTHLADLVEGLVDLREMPDAGSHGGEVSGAGRPARECPGAGAAGGIAFAAQALLGADLEPGFAVLARMTGADDALTSADLVLTGEGRLDAQSLGGKTPVGVARLARAAGVPVLAVVGACDLSDAELEAAGFGDCRTILQRCSDSDRAVADAAIHLRVIGHDLARDLFPGGRGPVRPV